MYRLRNVADTYVIAARLDRDYYMWDVRGRFIITGRSEPGTRDVEAVLDEYEEARRVFGDKVIDVDVWLSRGRDMEVTARVKDGRFMLYYLKVGGEYKDALARFYVYGPSSHIHKFEEALSKYGPRVDYGNADDVYAIELNIKDDPSILQGVLQAADRLGIAVLPPEAVYMLDLASDPARAGDPVAALYTVFYYANAYRGLGDVVLKPPQTAFYSDITSIVRVLLEHAPRRLVARMAWAPHADIDIESTVSELLVASANRMLNLSRSDKELVMGALAEFKGFVIEEGLSGFESAIAVTADWLVEYNGVERVSDIRGLKRVARLVSGEAVTADAILLVSSEDGTAISFYPARRVRDLVYTVVEPPYKADFDDVFISRVIKVAREMAGPRPPIEIVEVSTPIRGAALYREGRILPVLYDPVSGDIMIRLPRERERGRVAGEESDRAGVSLGV